MNKTDSRPDLYAALVRVVVTDNVHFPFGELDDTFFLELFDGLYYSCRLYPVNFQPQLVKSLEYLRKNVGTF
jgi:hypothetical protein